MGAVLYHAVQNKAIMYGNYLNKEREAKTRYGAMAMDCDREVSLYIWVGLIRHGVSRVAPTIHVFVRPPRETLDSSTNHYTRQSHKNRRWPISAPADSSSRPNFKPGQILYPDLNGRKSLRQKEYLPWH